MANLIKVYRWEGPDGYGPWHSAYSPYDLFSGSHLPAIDKDLNIDRSSFYGKGFLCACTRKNQLKEWFDEEDIEVLNELGFSIKYYVIAKDKIQIGKSGLQVLFHPDNAVINA